MNDRNPMKGEESPLHIEPIQKLSSAIHEKLSTSDDADMTALKESFENLIIGIGLQDEQREQEEEARHWIIILLVYLITLLISPFTTLYKNDNYDDMEAVINEQIKLFEEGVYSDYHNPSNEASEILLMIKSFLEMVKISIQAPNSSTPKSDDFDALSTSLLFGSNNSEPNTTNERNNYTLVPIYKEKILNQLNLQAFFKKIDALIESNITRLNSNAINIPDDIEEKLLPMMEELKKLLHDYQPEESWGLKYRKQKRKIAKLIHPGRQKNKEAAALIFPAVTHFLFEAIDKLIQRLDADKLINVCDDELESFFADIKKTFKNAEESIKRAKQVLKETKIFHQEAREKIQRMGEQIKQIGEDYRHMYEETKKANQEMDNILKRQDIRIHKMDILSQKTAVILEESKRSRLLSELMLYHGKKQFIENNQSIQESQDSIYNDISIINGILTKYELSTVEDDNDEPKPNIHQLFTEKSSLADKHTTEYQTLHSTFSK